MGSHRGCAVVAKEYAGNFSPPRSNPCTFQNPEKEKNSPQKFTANQVFYK
jgi:hypothetical protein